MISPPMELSNKHNASSSIKCPEYQEYKNMDNIFKFSASEKWQSSLHTTYLHGGLVTNGHLRETDSGLMFEMTDSVHQTMTNIT